MRSRFALALVLLALLVLGRADAFERNELLPGDTALGEILVAGTLDEYPVRVAAGSLLTATITKSGAGNYLPAIGVYGEDYADVPIVGIGPVTLRTLNPLPSGLVRLIVAAGSGSVGGYRLKTSVQPGRSFSLAGTPTNPQKDLIFGAYPGFTATLSIKWKGPAPVTLKSMTGPGGVELTSASPAVVKGSSSTQRGFTAAAIGSYTASLEVPDGTVSWSAVVRVAGNLPKGTLRDFRGPLPRPPVTIAFPAPGRFPVAGVEGELGGPNDCVLTSLGLAPDAAFVDGGVGTGGCSRAVLDPGPAPTKYLLFCNDGFFADVSSVERYDAGPFTGLVKSFECTNARSPRGSGSATLSDFTYDSQGRPTGWTEIRRFDATGRQHELVFSRAAYFSGAGFCREFRVTHRRLPDGEEQTYDYAPFR